MNKLILSVFTLMIGTFTACRKADHSQPNIAKDPSTANIHDSGSDFTISILYDAYITPNDTRTFLDVKAKCKEGINCGRLFVGDIKIPYSKSGYYDLIDPKKNVASNFTGKDLRASFSSSFPTYPSFEKTNYSPEIIQMSFPNLVGNKINRNEDLTINWVVDKRNADNDIVVTIEGCEAAPGIDPIHKSIINENAGSITFDSTILAKFANCTSVRIQVGRGYSHISKIGIRDIEYQFSSFCRTRLYFN